MSIRAMVKTVLFGHFQPKIYKWEAELWAKFLWLCCEGKSRGGLRLKIVCASGARSIDISFDPKFMKGEADCKAFLNCGIKDAMGIAKLVARFWRNPFQSFAYQNSQGRSSRDILSPSPYTPVWWTSTIPLLRFGKMSTSKSALSLRRRQMPH